MVDLSIVIYVNLPERKQNPWNIVQELGLTGLMAMPCYPK
jgi:hypothetical protein